MADTLTIVMPCFNEAETIGKVITDWCRECDRLGVDFQFRVYDAASTDGTVEILERLSSADSRIVPIIEKGLPHGESCLRGYNDAETTWVFQIDSDDELRANAFETLWKERASYDLLLGVRAGRESPLPRRIVTWGSRACIAALFGRGIEDVNTPFRLMRQEKLQEILSLIPMDTLAPNILVAGLMNRRGHRVFQTPVPHYSRLEGTAGLNRMKLLRTAWRCLVQTLSVGLRARSAR